MGAGYCHGLENLIPEMFGLNRIKDLLCQASGLCGFNEQRCLRCSEPCPVEKTASSLGCYSLALCDNCRDLLPRLESHFCPRCFLPSQAAMPEHDKKDEGSESAESGNAGAAGERARTELACPACHYNPPPWDQIYCHGVYGGALRELLLKVKFRSGLSAGHLSGLLLSEALIRRYRDKFADEPNPWDVVTAVPLHPARLRRRGLNQSLEIARVLAKVLNVPLRPLLLQRVVPTTPQAGLSQRERRNNLRGAIVCSGFEGFRKPAKIQYVHPDLDGWEIPPPSPGVGKPAGLTVLLVDDILTTGTTLSRCVESLLNAGARSVDVAVVARTPLGGFWG